MSDSLAIEKKKNAINVVVSSHSIQTMCVGESVLLPVRRASHEAETEGSHERPSPGVPITLRALSPAGQPGLIVRTEVANIERSRPADRGGHWPGYSLLVWGVGRHPE